MKKLPKDELLLVLGLAQAGLAAGPSDEAGARAVEVVTEWLDSKIDAVRLQKGTLWCRSGDSTIVVVRIEDVDTERVYLRVVQRGFRSAHGRLTSVLRRRFNRDYQPMPKVGR